MSAYGYNYKNFMEGAPPPPEGIDIRTNPWFQTAHPNYQWPDEGFLRRGWQGVPGQGRGLLRHLPSEIADLLSDSVATL